MSDNTKLTHIWQKIVQKPKVALFLMLSLLMAGCVEDGNEHEYMKNSSNYSIRWYFDPKDFDIYLYQTKINESTVNLCTVLKYKGSSPIKVYYGGLHPFTIHILDFTRDIHIEAPLIKHLNLKIETMKQGDKIKWCRNFSLMRGEYEAFATAKLEVDCYKRLPNGSIVKTRCSGELRSQEIKIMSNRSCD